MNQITLSANRVKLQFEEIQSKNYLFIASKVVIGSEK